MKEENNPQEQSAFEARFRRYIDRERETFACRLEYPDGSTNLRISDESHSDGTLEVYSFSFLIDNILNEEELMPSETGLKLVMDLKNSLKRRMGKTLQDYKEKFPGVEGLSHITALLDPDSLSPMISIGTAYFVSSELGRGRLPTNYKVEPIKAIVDSTSIPLKKYGLYDGASGSILIDYWKLSEKIKREISHWGDIAIFASETPICQEMSLEAELCEAARAEDFEKAAELRDKIRAIQESSKE